MGKLKRLRFGRVLFESRYAVDASFLDRVIADRVADDIASFGRLVTLQEVFNAATAGADQTQVRFLDLALERQEIVLDSMDDQEAILATRQEDWETPWVAWHELQIITYAKVRRLRLLVGDERVAARAQRSGVVAVMYPEPA